MPLLLVAALCGGKCAAAVFGVRVMHLTPIHGGRFGMGPEAGCGYVDYLL